VYIRWKSEDMEGFIHVFTKHTHTKKYFGDFSNRNVGSCLNSRQFVTTDHRGNNKSFDTHEIMKYVLYKQ
jgi:hypothetical protein